MYLIEEAVKGLITSMDTDPLSTLTLIVLLICTGGYTCYLYLPRGGDSNSKNVTGDNSHE